MTSPFASYQPSANSELEKLIIGGVLFDNATLALLPVLEVEDFQTFAGRNTWRAIRDLEAAGSPIDVQLLVAKLTHLEIFDSVGRPFLDECFYSMPLPYSTIEYAKLLRDATVKRRLRFAVADFLEKSAGDSLTGEELLTNLLAAISRIDVDESDATKSIGDIVKQRMSQLEVIAAERATGTHVLTGFPTGVKHLDEHIGGWQPGIASIVAARPAMGKSSLGLATADACTAAGVGVHLFSLEDTEAAYADRSMSRMSKVSAEQIRNVSLNRGELGELTMAISKLIKRGNWLVDGRSGITADEIVRAVRRKARENKTKVVIVDYIQLVKASKREGKVSRHEELTDTITTLANAAKQDGMAYVVMSQLNREVETRNDKRPVLSDLRESGSLEERAKCVVALFRGIVYSKTPDKFANDCHDKDDQPIEWHRLVELLVLKNSNGRIGTVNARFEGATTRIS